MLDLKLIYCKWFDAFDSPYYEFCNKILLSKTVCLDDIRLSKSNKKCKPVSPKMISDYVFVINDSCFIKLCNDTYQLIECTWPLENKSGVSWAVFVWDDWTQISELISRGYFVVLDNYFCPSETTVYCLFTLPVGKVKYTYTSLYSM